MIPALVTTVIVLPGEPIEISVSDLESDCRRVYSVDRNKIIDLNDTDEPKRDEKGNLTETLFGLCSISETREMVSPFHSEFLNTWFNEGGYDLDAGRMQELYEIARRLFEVVSSSDPKRGDPKRGYTFINVCFLALFAVETSRDWETGIEDVDDVYFHSEAKVVPR